MYTKFGRLSTVAAGAGAAAPEAAAAAVAAAAAATTIARARIAKENNLGNQEKQDQECSSILIAISSVYTYVTCTNGTRVHVYYARTS
jgi:hypothetical protein